MHVNKVAAEIVDTAVALHRELGPGLLESAYEMALARELSRRGLRVCRQVPVDICWDGQKIADAFRVDMIVEDSVIVELKSVPKVADVHKKQLLTYLRLSGKTLGLLLNFGQSRMADGIIRIVNGLDE